jgi:hypothetical protein
VDALLERLAALYYALAGLVVLLPSPRARALGASGVALVGLAAAADAAASPGGGAFTTVNESIGFAGMLVVAVALRLALRRTEADPVPLPDLPPAPAAAPLDPWLFGGLVLAAAAPHLLLLGLGAALGLGFAARASIRAARPLAVVVLVAGGLSLGTGLGLLLTILGTLDANVAGVAEGPISLAAERLLTILLGGGSLLLTGLPPLHRVPWGRQLAPLTAILLSRVVVPGFPAGLVTWQVPAMLVLTLGTVWAAVAGRWGQVAVGGGLLALWSGADGATAGAVLVAWGWLVEIGTAIAARRGVRLLARWRSILALPAVLAALPALRSTLQAQVLLSVVAVVGCVVGLLARWKRRPDQLQAPLY